MKYDEWDITGLLILSCVIAVCLIGIAVEKPMRRWWCRQKAKAARRRTMRQLGWSRGWDRVRR